LINSGFFMRYRPRRDRLIVIERPSSSWHRSRARDGNAASRRADRRNAMQTIAGMCPLPYRRARAEHASISLCTDLTQPAARRSRRKPIARERPSQFCANSSRGLRAIALGLVEHDILSARLPTFAGPSRPQASPPHILGACRTKGTPSLRHRLIIAGRGHSALLAITPTRHEHDNYKTRRKFCGWGLNAPS